ncbi:unnamed protein product [Choristocarpus tenellus]
MHPLGKRTLKKLASSSNDVAGAGYNDFAQRMMAKMGWKEGQGLGKDEQGRSTYVQVKKKDDNAGLGKEDAQRAAVNDQWYFNAFDKALASMGGKKKKKKSIKSDAKISSEEGQNTMSMYDQMFQATGGARMGMRARASQKGKWSRTESNNAGLEAEVSNSNVMVVSPITPGEISHCNGTSDNSCIDEGTGKKDKKRKASAGLTGARKEEDGVEETGVSKKRKRKDIVGAGESLVEGEGKGAAVGKEGSSMSERKKKKAGAKALRKAKRLARKEDREDEVGDGLSVGRDSEYAKGGKGEGEGKGAKKAKRKRKKEGEELQTCG